MQLIDTHTHLYCEEFDSDREATIQRALETGVSLMLLPAIDPESYKRQEDLADAHPDVFRQMMGLHPTSIKDNYQQDLDTCRHLLFSHPDKYIAVGEIGLDYYWDKTFANEQKVALMEQCRWALHLNKPVALHVRDAYDDILDILSLKEFSHLSGVLHCFSGTVEQAQKAISLGFHLGIGGTLTFKKSTLPEILQLIPLDRIILETDSPYLAPVPHRGKRNESAYIVEVARKLAETKQTSTESIASQTSENAKKLFRL